MNKITVGRDLDGNIQMGAPVGSKNPIKVTFTDGVFTLPEQCRLITSCSGSRIVVDLVGGTAENGGLGIPLPAPGAFPIVNVEKIKETGTDATDIYVWPKE